MKKRTIQNNRRLHLCAAFLGAVLGLAGLMMFSAVKEPEAAAETEERLEPEEAEETEPVPAPEPELPTEEKQLEPAEEEIPAAEEEPEPAQAAPVSAMHQGRYYYDQLDTRQRALFDRIYGGVLEWQETITFDEPVELELLERLVYILRWDFPELYYLDGQFSYSSSSRGVVAYTPAYKYTRQEYEAMQAEAEAAADELLEEIEDLSRYRRELYVHDWLIENVTYDESTENAGNLYGALVEGKAKCDGYSSAVVYLLRRSGIPSAQIIGIASSGARTEGHAWNVVEMNDGWYYLDVCWDDLDGALAELGMEQAYDYMNMTYSEMLNTRSVDETLKYLGEIPQDNLYEYSYYRKTGQYANSTADAQTLLENGIRDAVRAGGGNVVIKCRNAQVYRELKEDYTRIVQNMVNELDVAAVNCRLLGLDSRDTAVFAVSVDEDSVS